MNAKHTPGPWHVGMGWNVMCGQPTPGMTLPDNVVAYARPTIATNFRDSDNVARQARNAEANARLIAAAPDLLAALKACEAALYHQFNALSEQEIKDSFQREEQAATLARAAIAKAEGR